MLDIRGRSFIYPMSCSFEWRFILDLLVVLNNLPDDISGALLVSQYFQNNFHKTFVFVKIIF